MSNGEPWAVVSWPPPAAQAAHGHPCAGLLRAAACSRCRRHSSWHCGSPAAVWLAPAAALRVLAGQGGRFALYEVPRYSVLDTRTRVDEITGRVCGTSMDPGCQGLHRGAEAKPRNRRPRVHRGPVRPAASSSPILSSDYQRREGAVNGPGASDCTARRKEQSAVNAATDNSPIRKERDGSQSGACRVSLAYRLPTAAARCASWSLASEQ